MMHLIPACLYALLKSLSINLIRWHLHYLEALHISSCKLYKNYCILSKKVIFKFFFSFEVFIPPVLVVDTSSQHVLCTTCRYRFDDFKHVYLKCGVLYERFKNKIIVFKGVILKNKITSI